MAFFVAIVFFGLALGVPLWLSGRRRRGDITGSPESRDIDYDNPYPGSGMFSNRRHRR